LISIELNQQQFDQVESDKEEGISSAERKSAAAAAASERG